MIYQKRSCMHQRDRQLALMPLAKEGWANAALRRHRAGALRAEPASGLRRSRSSTFADTLLTLLIFTGCIAAVAIFGGV